MHTVTRLWLKAVQPQVEQSVIETAVVNAYRQYPDKSSIFKKIHAKEA